jgi:hypothetical protein
VVIRYSDHKIKNRGTRCEKTKNYDIMAQEEIKMGKQSPAVGRNGGGK